MKSLRYSLLVILFLMPGMRTSAQVRTVNLTIDPGKNLGHVSEELYGQFLEHLYHSVSNGIWGETVWNRSFEEQLLQGNWKIEDGITTVNALNAGAAWLIFGNDNWKNYTIETDARITEGKGTITLYVSGGDMLKRNKFRLSFGGRNILEMTSGYNWRNGQKNVADVVNSEAAADLHQWVHIKVACAEKRLKAWLNDRIVFDYTSAGMPKQGTPGIGAEDARVEFKNIKIYGAGGEPLLTELSLPARHWFLEGKGMAEIDSTVALNGRRALHIKADTGTNAIIQHRFSVQQGDLLKGSVWLKPNISQSVSLDLIYAGKSVAHTFIKAVKGEWAAYPFVLSPSETQESASFEIISKDRTDLYVDQVSLTAASALANDGFRPDLLKAVKDIRPALIRWPGGSFVEHYDFENGIGPQEKRIGKLRWDDYDPLSFGIDEYMRLCEKTGAEPEIVLCIGYHNSTGYDTAKTARDHWFRKSMDEMEYCMGSVKTRWGAVRAANGHPEPYKVKYWELDNEVWKMDPADYVKAVKRYAPVMRKLYPGIKIIACGSGGLSKQASGLDVTVLRDAAQYIDYISIHYYEDSGNYKSGISAFENFMAEIQKLIMASDNPSIRVFMSEWNLNSTDMRTGLYAGGLLNAMERSSVVSMATPALWLRHVSATGWDNAFVNFDQSKYFFSPNYLVMKLWRDHYAPDRISVTGDPDTLNAIATIDKGKKVLFLKAVNPESYPVKVELKVKDMAAFKSVGLQTVSSIDLKDKNSMEEPQKIKQADGVVNTQNNKIGFTLPAWSAGVVTINY